MTMPAGNYYIGDLCYAMHDEWNEMCDLFFGGRNSGCNEGEFTLKDGRRFANFNTAYGDGTYEDLLGRSYAVDSGSIGCILMEDIDVLDDRNYIRLGQVVVMPEPFEVCSVHGVIGFGTIQINTDPRDDEEEPDYDFSDDSDDNETF